MKVKTASLALIALLQGCASTAPTDLRDLQNDFAKDPPAEYESVLSDFFSFATAGDIRRMLSLTSDVTLMQEGSMHLSKMYQNDISPSLLRCEHLTDGGDVVHVTKRSSGTGSGWIFIKGCTNPKYAMNKVKFVLLRENGRIVVSYVGPG